MSNWLKRLENRELYTKFLSDEISVEELQELYQKKTI